MEMNKRLIALNTKHFADKRKNNRGYAETQTGEQLDELLRQEWLRRDVADIRAGQEEKKDWLPFICPHYTAFKDNHRAQDCIIPEAFTFMTCVDIDNPKLVERAFEKALEVNKDEMSEWKDMVLRMAYSARGKGHIYIRIPKGMTIEEAQRAFCEEIGFAEEDGLLDSSCWTPERYIYVTGIDQEVFRSEHWLEPIEGEELEERREAYLRRGLDVDGRKLEASPSPSRRGDVENAEVTSKAAPTGGGLEGADACPRTLYIFDACMKEAELSPEVLVVEGHRHEALKSILSVGATQLLKKEELMGVLKVRMAQNWQDKNIRQLVDDFYSKYYDPNQKMSQCQRKVLAKSLKNLTPTNPSGARPVEGGGQEEDWDIEEDTEEASYFTLPPSLKKNLAMGLKESLEGVPTSMHMPVLCAVLPIAAAYADQVEVQYCDGNMQKLGLMSIIRGEQASGKSVCKNVVDVWKRQFDEEDAIARKREEEWKERKKARKANEKAPDDPKVLIRTVPVTVSCSTLLKRFKNANGHCLYSFGEELDTLRKTNGAGSWSSKYDIYRLSFDNGEWGQDYNSDQAESGVVKVAYNWTMLGTDGAMRKCFKADNIENGLSSRVLVAEMPDSSFAKMPKFGKRSADDEAKIQEAVTRLRSYSGFVDTPRLRKAIERWVEEKRVEAAKDIDHVKDVYRKRAAVIGFRCGVIHFLLSGHESKATIQFALMMAEYTLEQQIKAFGEALLHEYIDARSECQRYGKNNSAFDQLPPVFTVDDLAAMRSDYLSRNSLNKIISRWNHDGWIVKADRKHWKKVQIGDKVTK